MEMDCNLKLPFPALLFYTGRHTITRMSHGLDEQSTFQLSITEAAQAMRWWKPSKLICIMIKLFCLYFS